MLETIRLLDPTTRLDAVGRIFAEQGPRVIHQLAPLAPFDEGPASGTGQWAQFLDAFHRIIRSLGAFDTAFAQTMAYSEHIYIICRPGVMSLMKKLWRGSATPMPVQTLVDALATLGIVYCFDLARKYD